MHLLQNLQLHQQHQTHQRVQQQHHWLDRLRSSKGFPTGQTPSLDSFLLNIKTDNNNNNNNNSSNSSYTRPDNPTRISSTRTRTSSPTPTTVGSLLSQIFNGASHHPNRKCPRKQLHPTRVLPPLSPSPSSSTTTATVAAVPDIVDSSKLAVHEREEELERRESEEEEDENTDGKDFKGFSKSEVTVIDMSSDEWKAVKFVYRKENVWKIRERKRKLRLLAKNKSNKKQKKSSGIPIANAVADNANEIGFSKENVINMGGEKSTHKSNLPSQ